MAEDLNLRPEGSPAGSAVSRRGFTILELIGAILAIAVVVALLLPNMRSGRGVARSSQCKNNLKQIGLALHNYADAYQSLPPVFTVDANGKPLHSWRTLILPYLDQAPLYATIDLSKPWNDPANAEAMKAEIPTFSCPSATGPKTHTHYLAVSAANGCFPPDKQVKFAEITDGTSHTLMVLEVPDEQAVHWMTPSDADEALIQSFTPKTKLAHSGGMHGLLVDGSVRYLSAELSSAMRRSLITIAGGEKNVEF